jgi:DNA-binding PadR family transcriptional regulator
MHGYQVMREINERSGGVWRPSPGSIYPTLQQLQDEDLVGSEESGRGRRLFALTDDGRTAAEAIKGDRAPWEAVGEDFTPAQTGLRDLVFQIGAAAKQVVVAGTPEQAARAEALLKETRRGLYRILAEDDPEPTDDASPRAPEPSGSGA